MKSTLRILIILLIIDIVGVAGLWFGYTSMHDKKNEEIELRKQLIEENEKGKKLIALKRSLATVNKDHAELSKFLYDSSEEGQLAFVSEIERLGTTTTGALVETVSLSLATEDPASFRGNFLVKGSWGDVFHFLRLLEEFPSKLIITRFDARGSSEGKGWAGGVQLNLNSLKVNN